MNGRLFLLLLLPVLTVVPGGCSGIVSLPGVEATVKPEYLEAYSRGGSMSTLWYHGSDAGYHHFSHSFKATTRYRIRRQDLEWQGEFPTGSRQPVYCSKTFARRRGAN